MKQRKRKIKSWGRLITFALLLLLVASVGVLALTPPLEEVGQTLYLDAPAALSAKPLALQNSAASEAPGYAPSGSNMEEAPSSPDARESIEEQDAFEQNMPEQGAPQNKPEGDALEETAEVSGLPYYLYLEKGSFTLTIYEQDENGEYTKVYKTYRVAHGGNKTPAGKFTLQGERGRERWHEFPDGGFVQYAARYHNRLYLHSPLYDREDARVMWPKYYDGEFGIGKVSTGGCIRMVTEAARFIYENCPEGTVFEIVNGAPKNTSSSDIPSRNGKRFDPTDVNVAG